MNSPSFPLGPTTLTCVGMFSGSRLSEEIFIRAQSFLFQFFSDLIGLSGYLYPMESLRKLEFLSLSHFPVPLP